MHVTGAGWTRASELQVREDIDMMRDGPPDPDFLITTPCPQWDVKKSEQNFGLNVSALGVRAWISPGTVFVGADDYQWSTEWTLASGDCNDFLRSEDWDDIPEAERHAGEWLRRLLKNIFSGWELGFRDAVRSGAAHLMARKNSVLQPFEQIVWDQWVFFKLDDPHQNLPDYGNTPLKWYGAHKWEYSVWRKIAASATGPAGERLYSIHVAPRPVAKKTPLEKCRDRIANYMRDNPDRCGMPVSVFKAELGAEFPDLPIKSIEFAIYAVASEMGKPKWLRAGRPKKESPENK
jgi:hypothetical protein